MSKGLCLKIQRASRMSVYLSIYYMSRFLYIYFLDFYDIFFANTVVAQCCFQKFIKIRSRFLGIFQTEKVAILNRNENICKKNYVLNFYHYCLQKKVRYWKKHSRQVNFLFHWMFFSGLEQGDPAEKREKNACNIRLFLKVSSIFYPDNTFILPPTVRHDACTMGQKCKNDATCKYI